MKVGLFINTQFPEGFAVAERVPEMVAQVRAARDAGFASLWFPHHWLTYPLQMLQITPVMGYIAAHAQGMTIGPNILILPPLNPVHVAEEAATLDVLTGGNYILGVGLGYRQPEFDAFGIPPQGARAAVQREHRADAPAVDRGPGHPPGPVLHGQRRRHRREADPPGRAAALYRRPGRGVGAARGADRRRLADRQQQRPRQDRAADADLSRGADGIRPHPDEFPITVECYVGARHATAHEECRGPLEYKYNAYAAWGLKDRTSPDFEDFARDRFIIGDKVSVKEEIARYRELLGVDHFIMRCQWPGLPQEQVLGSIKRLGEIFAS